MATVVGSMSALVALLAVLAVVYAVRGIVDARRTFRAGPRMLLDHDLDLPLDLTTRLAEAAHPNDVGSCLLDAGPALCRAVDIAVVFTDADRVVSRIVPGSAAGLVTDEMLEIDRVAAGIATSAPGRWVEQRTVGDDASVAMLVVPLVDAGRPFGVVIASRPGDDPFRLLELDTMCRFAALASSELLRLDEASFAAAPEATGRRHLDAGLEAGSEADVDADLAAAIEAHAGAVGFVKIEVDQLGWFRETHGAPAAAALMDAVAGLLGENVREGDVVYRPEADDFSVLLPDADAAATDEVSERLRAAVEAHDFDGAADSPDGRITISVGTTLAGDADASQVAERAGRALDEARLQGRNRVVVGGRS